jgi:twinkle protein
MINELSRYGINVKPGARGDVKTTCPKCSHTRKHKNDPCLSVNVDDGVWNCWNCSWSGTVKKRKEYTKPSSELKNLSEPIIKWFADRGISNQTLLRYKITESAEYMPQVEKEVRCINFNYFYENELVNIKYRDSAKNFKLVSGAMLSLYGLDVCLDNSDTDILLTEGEIGPLSWYECGIKFAVSVPNGASKGNQKLEWLDDLYHVFEGKRIYLATDMDEPGISLRNELARRLGKQNCWIVEFPEKDENDTLVKHGKEALLECFNNAKPFPVEGLEDANSKSGDLLALYDQGFPEGYNTGWDMDESFKIFPGQATLVTGIPGSGKTTWLKNLLSKLSRNHDLVNLIYSAEEANTEYALADILSITLNKPFFNVPGHQRITKEEVEYWTPWLATHFKYYKLNEDVLTIESILSKAEEMVKRFGINVLVIDNLSTVERSMSKNSDNRHYAIGEMWGDIVKFARNYGVHVFVVAHPKKMAKINGKYEVPTGYDVGDSSYHYNKPDNGLTVHRNRETGQTEVHRWKVRFRYTGQEGVDYFKFNLATNVFTSAEKLNDGSDKTKFKGQPLSKAEFARLAGLNAPGV